MYLFSISALSRTCNVIIVECCSTRKKIEPGVNLNKKNKKKHHKTFLLFERLLFLNWNLLCCYKTLFSRASTIFAQTITARFFPPYGEIRAWIF